MKQAKVQHRYVIGIKPYVDKMSYKGPGFGINWSKELGFESDERDAQAEAAWNKSQGITGGAQAGGFVGPKQTPETVDSILAKAEQDKKNLATALMGEESKAKGSIMPPPEDPTNLRNQQKDLAAERAYQETLLRFKKSYDALTLEEKRATIEAAKLADTEAYRDGEELLTEHIATQKRLATEESENEAKRIEDDLAAKKVELNFRLKQIDEEPADQKTPAQTSFAKKSVAVDKQNAEDEAARKTIANSTKLKATLAGLDKQGKADSDAAAKAAITSKLALLEEGSKAEEELNKKRLASGEITADQYAQAQIASIQAITEAQVEAAQKLLALGPQNEKTLQDAQEKITKYVQSAKEKLASLSESLVDLRLQDIQKSYQPSNKMIESQISFQQAQPGVTFSTTSIQLVQSLQKNLQAEMSKLVALAQTPEAQANPETWFKIYDQIENIAQAQLKWNNELRDMVDILIPAGKAFESIGQSIQQNFHSKFAQNLGAQVSTAAKGLSQAQKLGDQIAGRGAAKDPLSELKDAAQKLFDNVGKSATNVVAPMDNLAKSIQELSDQLQALLDRLQGTGDGIGDKQLPAPGAGTAPIITTPDLEEPRTGDSGGSTKQPFKVFGKTVDDLTGRFVALVQTVDSFAQSIMGAKSALGGGAGGSVGGLGLGKSISSAFGIASPWGALGGAAIGGIMGAIVGQKNAQVTANINKMNQQYKDLMQSFALNTNNLNDTITQLGALMEEAKTMQANSKKGSSQYQQLIDQYNQQLLSLQAQQHQIMVNLQEQLAIVTAPVGEQDFLSSIKGIIDQYKQFEGAAQSTTDLANATQFLVSSLQNYEDSLANQLLGDQQQAIQDALQLNDLLYQRQQLMLNYGNEVQGVLSQGVLTRQQTRAQTAGQKIQQITVEYQMQMDQMNEQIAADQFKVQAESQVFGLATTRIGLENQLLAAQEQQTAYDMVRIQALASLVQAISSGNLSLLPNLAQLIAAIPSITNPATGNSSPSDLTAQLDSLLTGAYSNYGSLGFGSFKGQNL